MKRLFLIAALFAMPGYGFAQDIEIGPGGVGIGEHHRDHDRGREERRHRAGEGDEHRHADRGRCRELRAACMHKEELGEEGLGNCRTYREECRR